MTAHRSYCTAPGGSLVNAFEPPLVRLGNLFPDRRVYAKCEFLSPSGSFKDRGANHLLENLRRRGPVPTLVVPSMGNTALGAAVAAKAYGARMVGVVPTTISRAKDQRLKALGVELVKVAGGGTDVLQAATRIAGERNGYFVHPHLDALWTDAYGEIAAEILRDLPDCRSLVFPVGGGGLLMGLTGWLSARPHRAKLYGCEAYNHPKYAAFTHPRAPTIADGLILEVPHPQVQRRIAESGVEVRLVRDEDIRTALAALFRTQGLVVEPSSAITTACVQAHGGELEEPVCVVLTGENITREDFWRLIDGSSPA
jgi:threonine dehydratase